MAAFATIADYEKRAAVTLPEGSPRRGQVEAYLDDASALMRPKIPPGHTPDPETTRAIAVAVTRRAIANSGGRRQRTIGQYSETLGEHGGLYLTEDEIAQLQPADHTDPDADAAYTVELLDRSPHGWREDPAGSRWGWM
ncbi:hypothetical protein [Streptomyces cyaneofuscatus]|uniref:hypothetical protein n=1 Tax=Streptomyces cyaneofuscatus TaxID=66883 RepID=UPI00382AF46E